jgi:enoyl-CoA hydratase
MIAMLRNIHKPSHATAKQRLRQGTMEAMRDAIERELTLSAYEASTRTRATVVMPRS